jgi:TnpA family transposase
VLGVDTPHSLPRFFPVSSRLEDLPTSIAACLAAHSMNVGYRPITKKGIPALERSRLSHVFQNYVRPETLAAANAPLVARQADLPLTQAWGGGLVAAVDGMRFVVPVPAAFARPNRKYFGSKRGLAALICASPPSGCRRVKSQRSCNKQDLQSVT